MIGHVQVALDHSTYAPLYLLRPLEETGVGWDTFHFFSNIAENIYDRNFEMPRQGRGILPLQTLLISYVVSSLFTTEYGVNDTWSNCPNLPRHGVGWDSTQVHRDSGKCVRFTGYIANEVTNVHRNCMCVCVIARMRVHTRGWTGARMPTRRTHYTNAYLFYL